jgi:hypothetical protein
MTLKFSSENEALQYLADVTGSKIKIAKGEYNKAWWKKFVNELANSMAENGLGDFYVDVFGDGEWEYEEEHKERAYGDHGPLMTVYPASANYYPDVSDYKFTPQDESMPLATILADMDVPNMPDQSVFMNPQDPMHNKLQKILKKGLPMSLFIEGEGGDFDSISSYSAEDLSGTFYAELQGNNIVPKGVSVNKGKFVKDLEDHIGENEEPPEYEPDYPDPHDYDDYDRY